MFFNYKNVKNMYLKNIHVSYVIACLKYLQRKIYNYISLRLTFLTF